MSTLFKRYERRVSGWIGERRNRRRGVGGGGGGGGGIARRCLEMAYSSTTARRTVLYLDDAASVYIMLAPCALDVTFHSPTATKKPADGNGSPAEELWHRHMPSL